MDWPSAAARRFIARTVPAAPDRSAANLPALRAAGRAAALAQQAQILAGTGVTLDEMVLGGVPCLRATPPGDCADWTLFYAFGGGFVQGSPLEDLPMIVKLAVLTGAPVIAPAYRLAPEHPHPAAIDDGMAVYRALSGRPLAMAGESAGGNLVLAVMQRARAAGLPLPGAAVLFSPWCDISGGGDSLTFNEGRDPTLTRAAGIQAAAHYAAGRALTDPALSPLHGAFDAGFPPCLISSGTRDLLLSQSVRLAGVLRRAGVAVDLQVHEEMWHVFEWYDGIPEGAQSLRAAAAHLRQHMQG
ncbi:MAG: alpha/beta hydrolase fold domain-containing protein [Limimaricola sp.]|uniref:alpha/beta hydrolase n=1 Tax=Limimaricola sp. TaxID=2211665 RepID=UPI001D9FE5DD|nr:alpha/beta hydrolase [Limimaricola sp.]MBI1418600.1 alpha/beta hydrolase fold domain-containing protein [Limimaricola sp.]